MQAIAENRSANKKALSMIKLFLVPETGFEPAHPFGRYHLKVVRLPISPPGQFSLKFIVRGLMFINLKLGLQM
jgi:hypothetical protein